MGAANQRPPVVLGTSSNLVLLGILFLYTPAHLYKTTNYNDQLTVPTDAPHNPKETPDEVYSRFAG